MINSDLGTGNWNEQKAKLKQKISILTGNDLLFEEGRREGMMQKLQIMLGKTEEELALLISNL
jgi:uncharacterized protein YjbJ (UPF0337 family)